eukprot:gene5025-904_t
MGHGATVAISIMAALHSARAGTPDAETAVLRQDSEGNAWWFEHAGRRFISAGVDHVMFTGDNFGKGSPYMKAVTAKYNGNRTAWAEATVATVASLGFNTLGSWSSSACPDCWQTDPSADLASHRHGMYITPIVDFVTRFNKVHNRSGFPDVFSQLFNQTAFDSAEAVCKPRRGEPLVLGLGLTIRYFLDNELTCPPVPGAAFATALASPLQTPSAGLKQALDQHSDPIGLAAAVAAQYFQVVTAAIRTFDPTHLILGCKFMTDTAVAPLY